MLFAGPPHRPTKESIRNDGPRTKTLPCLWPWSAHVILLILCALIAVSQFKEAVALEYKNTFQGKGTGAAFGRELYTLTEEGSDKGLWQYNLWSGVRELWEDRAYLLAIFIIAWSGLWPYIKCLALGAGLHIHRFQNLPHSYDLLSCIGHYSMIDVWFVLLVSVATQFNFEETQSEDQILLGFVNVTTTLELGLWVKAHALPGVYLFAGAIILSQIVCYVLIRIGCLHDWLLAPKPNSTNDHQQQITCICLGMEVLKPLSNKCWTRIVATLGGLLAIFGVFVLTYISLITEIFTSEMSFRLDIVINETESVSIPGLEQTIPVVYKESFRFEESKAKSYSVFSSISILSHDGTTNVGLFWLGIVMIFYLPLARILLIAIAWGIPLPRQLSLALFTLNEFISLLTNHDSYCVSYLIMCFAGQLDDMFEAATRGFGQTDDYPYEYELVLRTYGFWPGGVLLIVAAVVDQVHASALLRLHRQMLEDWPCRVRAEPPESASGGDAECEAQTSGSLVSAPVEVGRSTPAD